MLDEIRRIEVESGARVAAAESLDDLAALDRELLGKTSELSGFKRRMGALDHEGKRSVGSALNAATETIRIAVAVRRDALLAVARREQAETERLDLTEVRAGHDAGHLHLVTQTIEEL